jgi:hypothetical protein
VPALRHATLVFNLHAPRADTGVGLPVFPLLSLARSTRQLFPHGGA